MKKTMLAIALGLSLLACDKDKDDDIYDKSITVLDLGAEGSGYICQEGKCTCIRECQSSSTTPIKPPTVIIPPVVVPRPEVPTPAPQPTVAPQPTQNIGIDIDVQSSSSSTSGSTTQVTQQQSQSQCQKQYDFNQDIFTCKLRCPGKPPCLDKGTWTPVQGRPRTANLVYESFDCGLPTEEQIDF